MKMLQTLDKDKGQYMKIDEIITKKKIKQLIYNELNLEESKNLEEYIREKETTEWFKKFYSENNEKYKFLDFLLACFFIDEWSFNLKDKDYNVFMKKKDGITTYSMEDYLEIENSNIIDFLLELEKKGINVVTNNKEVKIYAYPYN